MIRWRFYEPNPAHDLLDQVLRQMPRQYRGELGRGEPMPMNVHETENETVIEASLPGVKPEDVEITTNEGVLTIRARTQIEEKDYHHQEIYSVEYQRQLSVPQNVRIDQARAEFENGILRVHLPKQQPKSPEKIRIEVTGGRSSTPIDATKGDGYSEIASAERSNPGKAQRQGTRSAASGTTRSRPGPARKPNQGERSS